MKKSTCVIWGISLAIAGVILSISYRPYIYNNQFFDYHIADTIGNIFAVPAALFFLNGINRKATKISHTLPLVVCAFIIYEFLGLLKIHGTFDIFDIFATMISGVITYLIVVYFCKIDTL